MRSEIKRPFFEIGPKTYLWGREAIDLAQAADEISAKYQVDIIFTAQATDLERIARSTNRIHVFAQSMDPEMPGAQFGATLPEALAECGVDGVMLNHSERPLYLSTLCATIRRAKEACLKTLICAADITEARAVACLQPDIVLVENPALIGGGCRSQKDYEDIPRLNLMLWELSCDSKIMHAAGIRNPEDVYNVILAGADGTGSTSAIMKAENRVGMLEDMIRAVRQAWDVRKEQEV